MTTVLKFFTFFLLLSFPLTNAILFTPSLPQIVTYFGLTLSQADLTTTAYLFGYGMGQLPYGPIANRFGRKKALYIGLSVSIIGSLFCALSSSIHSFSFLIFARFLQAIGASAGLKISFTMIADSYSEKEGTKMISLLGTGFAIVPSIGLITGGYLSQYFAWESCFYFLTLFGVGVLFLSTALDESSQELDPNALDPKKIIGSYFLICKNKPLMFSGLVIGFGTAISYIFNAKAPFIGIELLQMNPRVFGTFCLIPLSGMFVGSLLSHSLAGTRFLFRWFFIGGFVALIAALSMYLLFSQNRGSIFALFFPMFIIYMVDSIIFSNISSFGLARVANKANGSSILHFVSLSTAAIFMVGIKYIDFPTERLMPMSFILILGMILGTCFYLESFRNSAVFTNQDTKANRTLDLDQGASLEVLKENDAEAVELP